MLWCGVVRYTERHPVKKVMECQFRDPFPSMGETLSHTTRLIDQMLVYILTGDLDLNNVLLSTYFFC